MLVCCVFGMCWVCFVSRPPAGDLGWGGTVSGREKKWGNVVKCRKEAGQCVICCCIMTDCLRLPVFPPESGSVVAFLAVISVIFCSSLTEKYDIFLRQLRPLNISTDPNPKYGAHYFPRKTHLGENTLTFFIPSLLISHVQD